MSTAISLLDRYQGCLLGLVCGDAVGTTVEFMTRGSFAPVTDMVGGGPFQLDPGQWTDDTSMALCLAESLIALGTFDAKDQMDRYVRWWRDGHLSSTGNCFDIGRTTASALGRFERSGNPMAGATDPRSAGNGSLMRLAPVTPFFIPTAINYVTSAPRVRRPRTVLSKQLNVACCWLIEFPRHSRANPSPSCSSDLSKR